MPSADDFAAAVAFTEAYKTSSGESVAKREARCLELYLPRMFQPMRRGDLLAGRVAFPIVGFSPQPGGFGYFCRGEELRATACALGGDAPRLAEEVIAFWSRESTEAKCRAAYPPELAEALPSDAWTTESGVAFPLYRLSGLTPDFGELLRLGLPGLRAAVEGSAALARDPDLLGSMLRALDLLGRIAARYATEAEDLGDAKLARALRSLQVRPPRSFLEAVQLEWLYALASGSWNYGHMDACLGPFLAADLDSGALDEKGALDILCSLWRLIQAYDQRFDNRVYIGGRGRADEASSNRFALLAMEATRIVGGNQPQLSLRFYAGQDRALMDKALDLLAEGRTFPILYNDDVYIPAVERALGVSSAEAADYAPFGCGECVIPSRSVSTPSGVINLLKALEVSLHGGRDPATGRAWGPAAPASFSSFEELWADYAGRVRYFARSLALQERIEYDVAGAEGSFLFQSMLHADCVARGKSLLSGGIRHLGGTLESYGDTNVADSLLALKKLVFEEGRFSLEEVVRACDADFAGSEELRRDLLAVAKYGNDDDEADAMRVRVHEQVCRSASGAAAEARLDYYLIVVINNSANAILGRRTGASPDGRRAGGVLANGNNPAPGMDRSGVTAFLRSIGKLDPALSAGTVQNMKFSKRLCTEHRPKFEALLASYFAEGGSQAMVTVVSRGDLEAALRKPEDWGQLMVRVGGFSARYVELPRETQIEILNRTLYE
jgi:Pyruvate-formate lyase